MALGPNITALFEISGMLLEVAGVLAILLGAIYAMYVFTAKRADIEDQGRYRAFRANLGKGILLGLEFLVAADIVGTVAIDPSWNKVGVLAVVILMRTFLSFTLELEINRRFPWQKE